MKSMYKFKLGCKKCKGKTFIHYVTYFEDIYITANCSKCNNFEILLRLSNKSGRYN